MLGAVVVVSQEFLRAEAFELRQTLLDDDKPRVGIKLWTDQQFERLVNHPLPAKSSTNLLMRDQIQTEARKM